MNIYERIQKLASAQHLSIADVESQLALGNGTIGKWKNSIPKADKLYQVARFFNLPLEYFLIQEQQDSDSYVTSAVEFLTAQESRLITKYRLASSDIQNSILAILGEAPSPLANTSASPEKGKSLRSKTGKNRTTGSGNVG